MPLFLLSSAPLLSSMLCSNAGAPPIPSPPASTEGDFSTNMGAVAALSQAWPRGLRYLNIAGQWLLGFSTSTLLH